MLKKGGAWEGRMRKGGGSHLRVYYTGDDDDRSKCVSESPCPCKGGTEWSSCIRASGCKEGMGNIQKQMSLHMPIYGNQEQNSNTDNLTHPKLQLLQHAITPRSLQFHRKIFQIIKTLKLFFPPTQNRQSTWNNITNKIKRLKAKLRRLELCIPVEQLHRQPHSPIYSWALRDAQRRWEVMLKQRAHVLGC